ncbi:TIGR04554 family membrane protein [Mycoplasmopsis agalactiae]|uniref:TIGR04554 family membrane protein n=1 Tax=Mycoplasmopsis agalactiae TaxID=2110 RepID=UPI0003128B20|nr:TIGR04554 family membrane protein [Mycoplasmopsis agalactiae]
MKDLLGASGLSSDINSVAGTTWTALGAVGLVGALLAVILLSVAVFLFRSKFADKKNIILPAIGYVLALLGIILAAVAINKNTNPGVGTLLSTKDPTVTIKGTAVSGLVFGVLSLLLSIVTFVKLKKQQ